MRACVSQLEPYQLLDYFSMVGDSADNVPGIPGIGPKTAQELLEEFDTFEVRVRKPHRYHYSRAPV